MENMENEDTTVSEEIEPKEEIQEQETESTEVNETDEQEAEEPAGDNAAVEGDDVEAEEPAEEEEETFYSAKEPEPVDIQKFIDENGNLDAVAFNAAQQAQIQQAVQAAVQQSANERKYERTWDKAYETFPELRKNKELRDMVQAIHANSPATGKYLSPKQAAEKFFGFAGAAKKEGIKAATQTRTVQAAANLGVPATSATSTPNKVNQLRDKMHNAPTLKERQDANRALLEELITSGKV